MNNRINGTRFLNQEELAGQLLELDLKEEQYPMGGIPLLTAGNKVYVDATDSHSIIFGATGSKKTRMFAMPSIGIFARAGESFVVTDPKGELFQRTAGEVAAQGYEVCCLNLRDLKAGDAWNPLYLPYKLYHNGERAKAMELVHELAVMITDKDCSDEKFWTYTTVDVVCGLIFYLFETEQEAHCTLLELNKLWKRYIEGRRNFLSEVKRKFGGSMIMTKLSSLDNTSDKTVGSIESLVSMALNRIMVNEEMMRYLSRNSISLEELAEKKSAVYLVVPDENKTYHFAVSLFLEQMYEVLIKKAQESPGNTLAIRMNFLIDEFANIPKLENMDSMITASRSRNIRFHLIIQSMKQLRHKYDEYADVICSNCNNWVYLYSKEYELLQEISRLCGEVIYDNGIRVPLFSEFDLQHLDKDKGEALVLCGRNYPCISNLKDVDEYPFAKGDIKLPEKPKQAVDDFAEQEEPGVETVGLLAIGPEDVILMADYCQSDEVEASRVKKAKAINMVYSVPPESITWFTTENEMIAEYQKRKETLKNRFQRLVEFPQYSIQKVCGAEKPLSTVGEFQFELWKHKGETHRRLMKETIPDYGGEFGLYFAKRRMLLHAKERLDGTPYQSVRWDMEHEDGTITWKYQKKLDDTDFVCATLYGESYRAGEQ